MKPAPPVISAVRRAVIARAYPPTSVLYPAQAIVDRGLRSPRGLRSRAASPRRERERARCPTRAQVARLIFVPERSAEPPREPLAEDRDDSGFAVRRLCRGAYRFASGDNVRCPRSRAQTPT
jgi:hypothetical protein